MYNDRVFESEDGHGVEVMHCKDLNKSAKCGPLTETNRVYVPISKKFPLASCIVEHKCAVSRVIVVLKATSHAHEQARRDVEDAPVIVPELEHGGAVQSLENGIHIPSAHADSDGETINARG